MTMIMRSPSEDTIKLGKALKKIWETFLKNCKIFKIKFANFLMKTYASFLQRFVLYLKDAFSADTLSFMLSLFLELN